MLRRKPYPSDVSDEEWSLVAPYLTLMREDASQREHSLRELFNGLRYVIRYGIAWRARNYAVVFDLSTDAALAGGGRIPGARSGFAGGPAAGLGTPRGS